MDLSPFSAPYDPEADLAELLRLARWCQRFSPVVGLDTEDSGMQSMPYTHYTDAPESLLLDITGLAALFGGEPALAERVAREVCAQQLSARLATAGSVGAAWAMAHFGDSESSETFIHDKVPDTFLTLPIQALRLPAETVDTLLSLGLRHIGQVLALPRESLPSRFGPLLALRLDQALGLVEEPIVAVQAESPLEADWWLEHPTERREVLEAILQQLLSRLLAALSERGEGILEYICQFQGEGFRVQGSGFRKEFGTGILNPEPRTLNSHSALHIGLFQPSIEPQHLLGLLRLQMERLVLPGPVLGVRLAVTRSAPLAPRQRELFEDGPRDVAEEQARLLERLTARLGRQAVLRAVLCSEAQPEYACRYEPWLSARKKVSGTLSRQLRQSAKIRFLTPFSPFSPLERPLFLRRPVRLRQVVAAADGPPLRFQLLDQEYHTTGHWGPERIESGWWRRHKVQRDYYRVEVTTGDWLWLFRELKEGGWFLHGEFL
jgi:protein ImuB